MAKSLEERIAAAVREDVAIAPYDPGWPARFAQEAARLRARLPASFLGRIEHFGSTAVPGLAAKPVIDMLVDPHGGGRLQALGTPALPRLPPGVPGGRRRLRRAQGAPGGRAPQ